ncbi:MAG: trypsin-like peptidase domain-containing protein [Chloroflexi bacterium]|nr:trypsin-like peptidase domain-containing protein [Chloroflexota bacterium]
MIAKKGTGTAFLLNDAKTLVTANHVVAHDAEVKIQMPDGATHVAKVRGRQVVADVAVLSLDEAISVTFLRAGDPDQVRSGEAVIKVGFALGLAGDATTTSGIISAKRKNSNGTAYFQTDMPINPGDSGAAVIDQRGRVIGVVVSKMIGEGVEGLGFAVSIKELVPHLERLARDEHVCPQYPITKEKENFWLKNSYWNFQIHVPHPWEIEGAKSPSGGMLVFVPIVYPWPIDLFSPWPGYVASFPPLRISGEDDPETFLLRFYKDNAKFADVRQTCIEGLGIAWEIEFEGTYHASSLNRSSPFHWKAVVYFERSFAYLVEGAIYAPLWTKYEEDFDRTLHNFQFTR